MSEWKNGARRNMFLLFFIWFVKIGSFSYIATSGIKTNVVHLKNFIWWVGLILKFEKVFLEGMRYLKGIEEWNEVRLVNFN